MAKALGASDVIVLTDPLIINDVIHEVHEKGINQNALINELELKGDIFDLIIITSKTCVQIEELHKFLNPSGSIYFTFPPGLISDSFGFIPKFFFRWYLLIRYLLQVSIFLILL